MRTLMNEFRQMFNRYRIALVCGYTVAAWVFLVVYLFALPSGFIDFRSVGGWLIAPEMLVGGGRPTPLRALAAILANGGVYAALIVAATHLIRKCRRGRAQSDEA